MVKLGESWECEARERRLLLFGLVPFFPAPMCVDGARAFPCNMFVWSIFFIFIFTIVTITLNYYTPPPFIYFSLVMSLHH